MPSKHGHEVPKNVRDAAKKGLELHEEFGRGGTDVGVKMARKLSSGDAMTDEDVKHVSEYFPRHAADHLNQDGSDGEAPSNGYIAWLLWGGDAGRTWSEEVAANVEAKS
jgi:hypothetical protein